MNPVTKPEQAGAPRYPPQLTPNEEADTDLVEGVLNGMKLLRKPFVFALGALLTVTGANCLRRRLATRPRSPQPPRLHSPQPPPLQVALPTGTPDRDPTPDAELPPDKESQLADNEWGAADLELVAVDPVDLVEAIELLPDEPPPDEIPLVIGGGSSPVLHAYRRRALELAQRHAREYPRQEVGGILLGILRPASERQAAAGQALTIVTGIIRADTAISHSASLEFTPVVWAATLAIRDNHPIYSDEVTWQIVGWYHTHPGFGIFLSNLDIHFHQTFTHPGHLALVIDPINDQYGTFGWNWERTKPARLAEDARARQWKTVLDESQTLQLLNEAGLKLSELPPAELTADPPVPIKLLAEGPPAPNAAHAQPNSRKGKKDKPNMK